MKKFYSYILLAVVTMFTFAACQTDDTTTHRPAEELMTFEAIAHTDEAAQAASTRAELSGRETWWNNDDKIYIYDGNAVNEFSISAENTFEGASQSAKFSGTAAQNDSYIAVYGQGEWSVEDGVIKGVKIPGVQRPAVGHFDDKALISVAYTTDKTLAFTNLVTLIKFTVGSNNTVNDIRFSSTGSQSPAFTGNITGIANGTPTLENDTDGSELCVATLLQKGDTAYAVVAPGTYETLTCTMMTKKIFTLKDVTLKPGTIVNVGTIGEESTWGVKGSIWNSWGDAQYLLYNRPDANGTRLSAIKGVPGGTEFKFVKGSTWIGGHDATSVNVWMSCDDDGGNIILPAEGNYDIYLNETTMFYCIVKAGDPVPADTKDRLFLKYEGWAYNGARFAAYFFESDETWVSMERNVGYYTVAIPDGYKGNGTKGNLIFCRMDGGTTANNWNNKWDQTGDLTIPIDNKIFYNKPGDNQNLTDSHWSDTRI